MKPLEIQQRCPECKTSIGEPHIPYCSIERCPFCGGQMLQDKCCYKHFGIDVITMKETHPWIYQNGLPEAMAEKWEEHLRPHLLVWDGVWPGVRECREYNLWCKWTDSGWQKCSAEDPDASEDLNELAMCARWDKDKKRYVIDLVRSK